MYPSSTAIANIAPSQTDSSLVTAIPNKVIRVIGGFWVAAGTATNITFNSKGTGAGTAISSLVPNGPNGGAVLPLPIPHPSGEMPYGYFQTNKGEGLSASTGGGSTVGVTLQYITF